MKLDINFELEKDCNCKGYNRYDEPKPKCKVCNEYRMIPTELGNRILNFIREHTKINFNDEGDE